MRRNLSHMTTVLALVSAMAGPAGAQAVNADAPNPGSTIPGAQGDFVILLDAQGRALAGTYWIAPDVRAVTEIPPHGALPRPIAYVDREFLPTRSGDPVSLNNARISYSADASALDVGQSLEVVERRQPVGRFADQIKPSETRFRVTVKGKFASRIKGYDLVSRIYLKEPQDKDAWGNWGEHVFIEPFGMDIPAEMAKRVATLQTGKAGSAGDFFAILSELSAVALPDYVACIKRTRQTEAYKATVARDREIVDLQMSGFASGDGGWWERTEAPLDHSIEYTLLGMCPPPAK